VIVKIECDLLDSLFISVLATLNHRASVLARIPVVSYPVWIDVYLTVNLWFNVFAVVGYACVNYGMQRRALDQKAHEARLKKDDVEAVKQSTALHADNGNGHAGGDPDAHEHNPSNIGGKSVEAKPPLPPRVQPPWLKAEIQSDWRQFLAAVKSPSLGLLI